MKILTVIGARPQFIKAATVSRLIRSKYSENCSEVIVHTGQHYDHNMSLNFFQELDIPTPKYNLEVGSGSHGKQCGAIMVGLEVVVERECPDWVLVYGDTNSTLAGALVASKVPCKLAHVEAGLRSHRWGMAEEVNRVVTDRLSNLLCCPTTTASNNLALEGSECKVIVSGDVMYDSFLHYKKAVDHDAVMRGYRLTNSQYLLVTIHRAENTDDLQRLEVIITVLRSLSLSIDVVLPLHPRTRKVIEKASFPLGNIKVIEPVPYLDMIALLVRAATVITDSGGLQKEAYFAKVPCVTVRDETEWSETLEYGWNRLVPVGQITNLEEMITGALEIERSTLSYHHYYGDGTAAQRVVEALIGYE